MKVLVTPLNWGLGHATRCIPIINKLIENKVEVIIGSDGRALSLLKKEFPNLTFIDLPPYDVNYNGTSFNWTIFRQIIKIQKAISSEREAIQKVISEYEVDFIISDNRYGCYSSKVPSFIITHQTNILNSVSIFSFFATKVVHSLLKNFNEIWIPDNLPPNNLSGLLNKPLPKLPVHYIGVLSRMSEMALKKEFDILIILSGPEPKRTQLEEVLIQQAFKLKNLKIAVVQGKSEGDAKHFSKGTVEVFNYLTSGSLNTLICKSELIICRSGYTSLMDLSYLKKKVLFIPTKGQPEQEYLGRKCHTKNWANLQSEDNVDIKKAYENRLDFNFNVDKTEDDLLGNKLDEILSKLLST